MPHVLAPRPPESFLSVFFNLDSSVGNRGANSNREDILLAQFIMKALSQKVHTEAGRKAKPILAATPLSGVVDEATVRSIMAIQEIQKSKEKSTIVDGRISPARGYRYTGGYYTIVFMSGALREDFRQQWPRLDQIPGCPPSVKQMVTRLL